MPPVEAVSHTPLEVNEIFIAPNIEELVQNCDALHGLSTAQTDEVKLYLENVSPMDIPQVEQNLMFLLELTLDKVTKLQKMMCHATITDCTVDNLVALPIMQCVNA